MAKFCGKCGSRLDETTGLCPNCDAEQLAAMTSVESTGADKMEKSTPVESVSVEDKQNSTPVSDSRPLSKKETKKQKKKEKKAVKKAKKKEKRTGWSIGKKIRHFFFKLILIILLLGLLAAGIVSALVYLDVVEISFVSEILTAVGFLPKDIGSEDIDYEHYKVNPPDADEYFRQNSQIIREINANESNNVLTEAEVADLFFERGFVDKPITTEYAMDGTYSDAVEISDSSTTKHPMYQTFFVTKKGEIWTILVIENNIMAIPLSYKIQANQEIELIVAEKASVTSYDSTTNKFYETIPHESVQIVKVINEINSESLSSLTIEVIDNEN